LANVLLKMGMLQEALYFTEESLNLEYNVNSVLLKVNICKKMGN